MDRPLPREADERGAKRFGPVPVEVAVVRERPVDGFDPGGARGDDDARAVIHPDVAGVLGLAGDVPPDALRRGEVSRTEDQRLEPFARTRDAVDVDESLGFLDEDL